MTRLSGRIAAAWLGRRSDTGLFVDPLTGGSGHGYGPAALAGALMRAGRERGDPHMLRAGVRALRVNSERALDDGTPGNPIELFAIVSAYRWAQAHLASDPVWRRGASGPRRYLERWTGAAVGRAARRCFADPSCWNNYKAIRAAGVLMLLETGLPARSPGSPLADPQRARERELAVLTRDVGRAIGRRATAQGPGISLSGLGLLSDQPTYPLAYHALSVAAIARALATLGDAAPAAAREHFRRAMLAEAAFMAPDGDTTYLGRAQGESWALGATAYAGEECAAMFRASHPGSAGICAGLAVRAAERLRTAYRFRRGVLPIVPRFSVQPLTGHGLEHYVRVMTFNGLTAMFLADAAAAAPDFRPAALPLDRGGAFADHDRARLAAVRHGRVWFAVHTVGPSGVEDVRYDFGLVALKLQRGRRWVDVVSQRPFLSGLFDGGGPALVTTAGLAFPRAPRFTADPRTGVVTARGGYRYRGGPWAVTGERFRFAPLARGVRITVTAPPGASLRFQDFLPAAFTMSLDGGAALQTPTASSRLSVPPLSVTTGLEGASATAAALVGFRRLVTVPPDGRVSWTVTGRSVSALGR